MKPRSQMSTEEILIEEIKNLLGVFDTPIARRKLSSDFVQEVIESARTAVAQAEDMLGSPSTERLVGYANGDELDNMLDDRSTTISPIKTGQHRVAVYRKDPQQ